MAEQIDTEPRVHNPIRSVFINCPFDPEYTEHFDALIFSIACCGFFPRSTLEAGGPESRINSIMRLLSISEYSIHDLCRCRGEGDELLGRFNMPFELGMAVMLENHHTQEGRSNEEKHKWFFLVPQNVEFRKFISDLAGYDPKQYDGTIEDLVRKVVSLLSPLPEARRLPPPSNRVFAAFPEFVRRKKVLEADYGKGSGDIPWRFIVDAARRIADAM